MARTSTRTRLPRGQVGIQNFARATKPGVTAETEAGELKPKIGIGKKESHAPAETATERATERATETEALPPATPSKKRKLNHDVDENEEHEEETATAAETPSKTLRIGELSVSTPRSCRRSRNRNENKNQDQNRAHTHTHTQHTPVRPTGFDDLLSLHSSFLKALGLHFAHNGMTTPADLREFLRNVERIWKRRKVSVKDLQRLVWVWEQGATSTSESDSNAKPKPKSTPWPSYRIANYGLGKVCLETSGERISECICEDELQVEFERILERLWEKCLELDEEEKGVNVDFIETLGLAPIHESLTPLTSFRAGQQRLQDLKGGIIRVKTEALRARKDHASVPGSIMKTPDTTTDRRKSLLDRIKSKQLLQSKLPPPPSKEMLLRRAAAERVEDVARVLALLRPSTGSVDASSSGLKSMAPVQRRPFRFDTIVQHVQDSIRNPISHEEVDACLQILSQTDVAGHWVTVVTVKGIRSVVLKSFGDVSPKEIGGRVRQMKIGWVDSP